jgi:2-polyprenyl-6-methoxyphenol hydroxylase-like FAD-dependent oxidoreductase
VPSNASFTPLPASTQVLIAGAGPVGLAAAVELGRRGISCVVIEPRAEVSRARPRCKTVNVRTMEHLRRWGVAERLRAAAPLSPTWSQDIVFCTTLSGRELSRFTGVFGLDADPDRCAEVGQQAPQYVFEEVLREVVDELPTCALARGARVIGIEQWDSAVRVMVETADGSVQVEAEYVIGCDGSRSTVRSAVGARYVGDVALRPNFGFVIRAPELWGHVPHGRALHYWILNDDAPGSFGPLDGDTLWWGGFIGVGQDRGERELRDLLRTAIGCDVPLEVLSTDPWTAHMEIVDSSRVGRVFLAGDAAHLNPPWGGHGMNTGFGDAVDVGWKLAAVLEGWGGPALLDSYDIERRPVQIRIIEEAKANMAVLSSDLLTPHIDENGPTGDEARRRLHERIQETKTREFHSLDLILDLGYDDSPIVAPGPARGHGADPLRPGFRLPHARVGGQSIFDMLGPGFTLIRTELAPDPVDEFVAGCAARNVPLKLLTVEAQLARHLYGSDYVLVRPDQHVAFAADALPARPDSLIDIVRGAAQSADQPAHALEHGGVR